MEPARPVAKNNVKTPWYERRYLVDPKVQLRIIAQMTAVALLFTLLICFISYKWVLDLRPIFEGTLFGPMKPIEAFQIVADKLLFRLLGVVIIMFTSFSVVGIYVTFRFAGPIWRLQKDLNRFFEGEDIGAIHFRKRDDYKSLAELINRLISDVQKRRK